MLTRFIGDVHGKYRRYRELLHDSPPSIQIGDMGVGFFHNNGRPQPNPPFDVMIEGNHRFIRGNHDNPKVCQRHTQWIADGIIENDVMFIGGALSIDKEWRVEGDSWWADEELSSSMLTTLVDLYTTARPRVMVTHDCPASMAVHMCDPHKLGFPSRTQQAFQSMFEIYQPELWIFGHWHKHADEIHNGTRFICLAELQHMDIDL